MIALQIASDWVLPHWLQRQVDPTSAAFVPRGRSHWLSNVTNRNWTAVGNLDSPGEAIVDPRGLVTPWSAGWSLDWWIGADDRWHVPSREAAVRQHLVEASPVVETSMRVPGGDVVQRTYGIQRSSTDGGGQLVVVEVENQSKVPVALALALRPYNPEGLARVERIALQGGTAVIVDGQVALLLPKAPGASAASTFDAGDSAAVVMAGDAPVSWAGEVHCEVGLAQAAFVYPLAHGTTLRAALPLAPEGTKRRSGPPGTTRRQVERPVALPAALPAAGDVARGWKSQSNRGMRLELPDDRLAEAVDANRRFLLLVHDDQIAGGDTHHQFHFRDAAFMLSALDYYGFSDEVARVLVSFPERQGTDGCFSSRPAEQESEREWDANGTVLWSLAQHWRLTHDRLLVDAMADPIASAAHWIERARQGKARQVGRLAGTRSGDERLRGLLPAGSAEHLGPHDSYYWDDFWGVAGLRAAAELFGVIDQPEAAAGAAHHATSFWADLEASIALNTERLDTSAIPAGPQRHIDAGLVGSLVAAWPLELMAPDDERIVATADTLRARYTLADGKAVHQAMSHAGLSTYLTMLLACVELAAGDRRCVDRLGWLLDAASGTWTWPAAIHPRLAGGCGGDGHSGWAAAELLRFVRQLLVREVDGGLALASVVPDEWLGQGCEVHDAPTAHGLLSYAIRWHGDRPALLWDLRPHETDSFGGVADASSGGSAAGRDIRLTAPGLDRTWSTSELRGEALLAPVESSGPATGSADAATQPHSFS